MKVSVLIPTHNEEKVIANALEPLGFIKKHEYPNLEVLVGLDGCTDKTENIVRKFKFARIIKNNEREGKAKMLSKLIREAKGDIILIHDADWFLQPTGNFKRIVDYFKDPKVGGIADYRPADTSRASLLIVGDNFMNQFLHEYKIMKYAKNVNGKFYVRDNKYPFFVNMFRKKALIGDQLTLCDDGERSIQLRKNGYEVLIPTKDFLHFGTVLSRYPSTPRDLIRIKSRGEIARRQIKESYGEYRGGLFDFYLPAMFYSIRRAGGIFLGVILYWFFSFFGVIKGKLHKKSTKEGWKIRVKR